MSDEPKKEDPKPAEPKSVEPSKESLPASRRMLETEIDDLKKENARLRGDVDKLLTREIPNVEPVEDEDDVDRILGE